MRNCRWLSLVLDLGSPTWQSRGAESTVTAAPPNSKQKDRVNIAFPEVLATLCAFIDAFALQHRDNIICIYGCNAVKVDPIFIGLARLIRLDALYQQIIPLLSAPGAAAANGAAGAQSKGHSLLSLGMSRALCLIHKARRANEAIENPNSKARAPPEISLEMATAVEEKFGRKFSGKPRVAREILCI